MEKWKWAEFREWPLGQGVAATFSHVYPYENPKGEALEDHIQLEVKLGMEDLPGPGGTQASTPRGFRSVQVRFVSSQRYKTSDFERSMLLSLLPLEATDEALRRAVQELCHALVFLSLKKPKGTKEAEGGDGPVAEPVVRSSVGFLKSEGISLLKQKSERFRDARYYCHWCDYHVRGLFEAKSHIAREEHSRHFQERQIMEMIRDLPPPPPAQAGLIGAQLRQIASDAGRPDQQLRHIRHILAQLQQDLQANAHPGMGLRLYGSCQTGLALRMSNVNVQLLFPETELLHNAAMERALAVLRRDKARYADVREDFGARCPKVVFRSSSEPELGEFHVSVGNDLAFSAGELLRTYAEAWAPLRSLAHCFRVWANLCCLGDSEGGSLPPYAFDLLLVHFLQRRRLLPVLHQLPPRPPNASTEWYQTDSKVISAFIGQATEGGGDVSDEELGRLWLGLFRYLAIGELEEGEEATETPLYQVRDQKLLRRTVKASASWQRAHCPIEDPFMPSKNLGAGLKGDMWAYWSSCLRFSLAHFSIPRHKPTGGQLVWIFTNSGKLQWNPAVPRPPAELASRIPLPASLLLSKEQGTQDDSDERLDASTDLMEEMLDRVTLDGSTEDDELSYSRSEMKEVMLSATASGALALTPQLQKQIQLAELLPKSSKMRDQVTAQIHRTFRLKAAPATPAKMASASGAKEEASPGPQRRLGTAEELGELWQLAAAIPGPDLVTSFSQQVLTNGSPPVRLCGYCSQAGHSGRACEEKANLRAPLLPPPAETFLHLLEILAKRIYDHRRMSQHRVLFQEHFVTELTKLLQDRLKRKDARLELFGSSRNGFGFETSDLDLCLRFKDDHLAQSEDTGDIIRQVGAILSKDGRFRSVWAVTAAKVPIVKFGIAGDFPLDGDISLYNTLALRNTALIRAYCALDERFRILGYLVKAVAKAVEIGDASRGSLSSYAYVLMLIHFLQSTEPPVLPVLQEAAAPKDRSPFLVEGWDTYFHEELETLGWVSSNTLCVSQLFLGFLDYYTTGLCFDLDRDVVQIRRSHRLSKLEKQWSERRLAIEDPFELSHNLAQGLSNKMFTFILRSLARIRQVFSDQQSFNTYLQTCSQYSRSWKDSMCAEQYFLGPILRLPDESPPDDRLCRFCKHVGHFVEQCPERLRVRHFLGPILRLPDESPPDDRLCRFCKHVGHFVEQCPERLRVRHFLGPILRLPDESPPDDRLCRFCKHVGHFVEQCPERLRVRHFLGPILRLPDESPPDDRLCRFCKHVGHFVEQCPERLRVRHFLGPILRLPDESPPDDRLCRFCKHVGHFVEQCPERLRVRHFLGPILRLPDESPPDDRLCRFCKHVGHFVEQCPERLRVRHFLGPILRLPDESPPDDRLCRFCKHVGQFVEQCPERLRVRHFLGPILRLPDESPPDDRLCRFCKHVGHFVEQCPERLRVRHFLGPILRLPDESPPDDRLCRFCKHVGHFVEQCPERLRVRHFLGPILRLPDESPPDDRLCRFCKHVGHFVEQCPERLRVRHFLGPILRLPDESPPDDRLCRFCKHVGHFVEQCPERLRVRHFLGPILRLPDESPPDDRLCRFCKHVGQFVEQCPERLRVRHFLGPILRLPDESPPDDRLCRFCKHVGQFVEQCPERLRVRHFLGPILRLPDESPPDDRLCRFCKHVGHFVEQCPERLRVRHFLGPILRLPDESPPDDRLCRFCKHVGQFVEQCPERRRVRHFLGPILRLPDESPPDDRLCRFCKHVGHFVEQCPERLRVRHFLGPILRLPDESPPDDRLCRFCKHVGQFVEQCPERLRVRHFLGPILRLPDESPPDDRLCRFCKHVGHFVEQCPERLRVRHFLGPILRLPDESPPDDRLCRFCKHVGQFVEQCPERLRVRHFLGPILRLPDESPPDDRLCRFCKHVGQFVEQCPERRRVRHFLGPILRLPDESPPDDRLCRFCKHVGHFVEQCPERLRVRHFLGPILRLPDESPPDDRLCRFCKHVGQFVEQCPERLRVRHFLGPILRLPDESPPDDRLCRFCKHVGHFVEQCPERLRVRHFLGPILRLPDESPPDDRLCRFYKHVGHFVEQCPERLRVRHFLGPILRLPDESPPDDRLCRFCKHVGHFVEQCPERLRAAARRRGPNQNQRSRQYPPRMTFNR